MYLRATSVTVEGQGVCVGPFTLAGTAHVFAMSASISGCGALQSKEKCIEKGEWVCESKSETGEASEAECVVQAAAVPVFREVFGAVVTRRGRPRARCLLRLRVLVVGCRLTRRQHWHHNYC